MTPFCDSLRIRTFHGHDAKKRYVETRLLMLCYASLEVGCLISNSFILVPLPTRLSSRSIVIMVFEMV